MKKTLMTMPDPHRQIARPTASFIVAALFAWVATGAASATEWMAWAGAQSPDMGNQALAFLPNEYWIYAGDSIHWTFTTGELHTVSFLKSGQVRPALNDPTGNFIGCPGITSDGSSFDNSSCVTSGTSTTGQTFTVNFPSAGNFKLVCLVHTRMTGAIHVLPPSEMLPYDQGFYDLQAGNDGARLLAEAVTLESLGKADSRPSAAHIVTSGISAVVVNGGGSQTISVMRFQGARTVVHVGDTVEWTNLASPPFHTITFGTEPANLMPPSPGVTLDPDGVRHAQVSSSTDSVNSGFLGAPNQETVGQPQATLDFTRFRVTFTAPGTFNYICGLHDLIGMTGKVIVQP
jgi:plastocyanin